MKSHPFIFRQLLCGLVILLGASPCIAQSEHSKNVEEFNAAVVELRKVETVASTHIGFLGVPSQFGEVSRRLLSYGTEEDFLRLLEDKSPVARSMGLYCLAQTDVKKHMEVLKRFVEDTERIRLILGCVVDQRATVGRVARLLLDDPKSMNYYTRFAEGAR